MAQGKIPLFFEVHPARRDGKNLEIRGWCLSAALAPITSLRATVGTRRFPVRTGLSTTLEERFAFLPKPALSCGFECTVRTPWMAKRLVLEAKNPQGKWRPFYEGRIGRVTTAGLPGKAVLPNSKPARRLDLARLSIGLKIAVPSWEEANQWGDYHFALALQRCFEARGHSVRIDINPEWNAGADDDVALVLRGRHRYKTRPDQINLMWNISHPDRVVPGEYASFDHVFIASVTYAEQLRAELGSRVSALLQCTDPGVFRREISGDLAVDEVLFVGNSRNQFRRIIKDSLEAGVVVGVYGTNWSEFIPAEMIRGEHIENTRLNQYYSGCKILLNDHWETMAANGFLSNRLFDAGACGAFVISDHAEGIEAVFEGNIPTYRTPGELKTLHARFLNDPDARRQRGEALQKIVLENHTFEHRARAILDRVAILAKERERTGIFAGRPSKPVPARLAQGEAFWRSQEVNFVIDSPGHWLSRNRTPAPILTNELPIRGWCYSLVGEPVSAFRARIGGRIIPGEFGIRREELANSEEFPGANPESGFELKVPVPISPSELWLEAKVGSEWKPVYLRKVSCWRRLSVPVQVGRERWRQRKDRREFLALASGRSYYHDLICSRLKGTTNAGFWKALLETEQAVGSQPLSPKEPLVSVVMPSYNRAEVLPEALRSLREQSYQNWELHLCDDGSEQSPAAFLQSLNEPRIHFHQLSHGGAAAARNRGLEASKGRYIAYLDTDNLWHPEYLQRMVTELEAHPERSMVYCPFIDVSMEIPDYRLNSCQGSSFDFDRLAERNFIDLNGIVHRRELLDHLGGFDESLIRLQDWDLALRYTFGRDPAYLPQFLVLYRRNAAWGQLTTKFLHVRSARETVLKNIEQLFAGSDRRRPGVLVPPRPRLVVPVHVDAAILEEVRDICRDLTRDFELTLLVIGGHGEAPLADGGRELGGTLEDPSLETAHVVLWFEGAMIQLPPALPIVFSGLPMSGNGKPQPSGQRTGQIPGGESRTALGRLLPIIDERRLVPTEKLGSSPFPKGEQVVLWMEAGHVSAQQFVDWSEQLRTLEPEVRLLPVGETLEQLRRSDVYLLWDPPQKGEAFPPGLFSAMALGVPILADGLEEEFRGISLPSPTGDLAAVRAQIRRLSNKPSERGRIVRRAWRLFIRRCSRRVWMRNLGVSLRRSV